MTEPDLNFIAERLREIHTDIIGMRAEIAALSDGQTVLTHAVFRLERDIEGIKGLLGRMDARIAHLEE